ncbi:MAG TPA: heavy-metal-associated domain-containing protein [Cytophagaceae bacterium]
MKYTQILSGVLLLIMSACNNAPQNKAEFYVRGNCEMCKERIEATVKGLKGVSEAVWNIKTDMLAVSFDSTAINEEAIQKAVAQAGHDTELFTTEDVVHDALPECCKRRESDKSGNQDNHHHGHDHGHHGHDHTHHHDHDHDHGHAH